MGVKGEFALFRRPCERCDKTFKPNGRFQRVCEKCKKQIMKNRRIKCISK